MPQLQFLEGFRKNPFLFFLIVEANGRYFLNNPVDYTESLKGVDLGNGRVSNGLSTSAWFIDKDYKQ